MKKLFALAVFLFGIALASAAPPHCMLTVQTGGWESAGAGPTGANINDGREHGLDMSNPVQIRVDFGPECVSDWNGSPPVIIRMYALVANGVWVLVSTQVWTMPAGCSGFAYIRVSGNCDTSTCNIFPVAATCPCLAPPDQPTNFIPWTRQ